MTNVTRILNQIENGDPSVAGKLLPLVYEELRKLAAAKLANEKRGQTSRVHDAYIRRVDVEKVQHWNSRGHFFEPEAMRRILVDSGRRKKSAKAGGGLERVQLNEDQIEPPNRHVDLIALNEALDKLANREPRKAEFVKLRKLCRIDDCPAMGLHSDGFARRQRAWIAPLNWIWFKQFVSPVIN